MNHILKRVKLRVCGYVLAFPLLTVFVLLQSDICFAEPQQSTKQRGEIMIQPDASLQDGRLIIRVAVQNRDKTEEMFSLESINITTSSGKPVALLTSEQLSREVLNAAVTEYRSTTHSIDHQQNNYSMNENAAIRDTSGTIVSGNNGGAAVGATSFENSLGLKSLPPEVAAKVSEQVTALKSGLLKSGPVLPGKTIGGQIVTDKLRFGRKESRTLNMTITFNQEQHAFVLAVPADQK